MYFWTNWCWAKEEEEEGGGEKKRRKKIINKSKPKNGAIGAVKWKSKIYVIPPERYK